MSAHSALALPFVAIHQTRYFSTSSGDAKAFMSLGTGPPRTYELLPFPACKQVLKPAFSLTYRESRVVYDDTGT